MALGLYFEAEGLSFDKMLGEIRDLGASHVAFVVHWAQDDVTSSEIAPDPVETLPDTRLRAVILKAHSLGLRVLLLPIVHLRTRRIGQWRGTLKPTDWEAWWSDYRRFLMHYTDMAAQTKVELLSVGSELVTTEADRGRWATLIKEVRARYRGRLLYSANWDHYRPVAFWDLVDVIGLTGYHKLTESKEPSLAELTASWQIIRKELVRFQREVGKPLLFTELGYPSQDGAASHPWDYTTSEPVDLLEQALCYRAFVEAWKGERALAGVFFWNWFGYGGEKSTYYTPKGKPAEGIIRAWFAGDPP